MVVTLLMANPPAGWVRRRSGFALDEERTVGLPATEFSALANQAADAALSLKIVCALSDGAGAVHRRASSAYFIDETAMNTNSWVLLADSSRARVYSVPEHGKPWTLVGEYTHDASRVTTGGLTTGQPGRTHGSGIGKAARSAMESKSSPKEVEIAHFAYELIEVLHHGHGQQAYERIVLVAPPHFLGLLRKGLNHTVSKLIAASVDKDFLHLPEAEIHAHLDALLQPADGVAKPVT